MLQPSTNRKDAHPSADLYALGVILHQMLTGRVPSAGFPGVRRDPMVMAPGDPTRQKPRFRLPVEPRVGRELEAICNECLWHRPEDRYPDVDALIRDLDRFLDGYAVDAFPSNLSDQRLHPTTATTSPPVPFWPPAKPAIPPTTIGVDARNEPTRSWWPFRRSRADQASRS